MSQNEAKKQFRSVIRSDLNRWWEESNLDAEELAKVALKAIEDWLDEEIVGFEGGKGRGGAASPQPIISNEKNSANGLLPRNVINC